LAAVRWGPIAPRLAMRVGLIVKLWEIRLGGYNRTSSLKRQVPKTEARCGGPKRIERA